MSSLEFDLCVTLNTRPGREQSSPDLLKAMRRVLVDGLGQVDAREDIPTLSKQALFNGLTRMNAQYATRIAILAPEQFDFAVRIVCPEISDRVKTLARGHLVEGVTELPAGNSNSASEARELVLKLRDFHLQALCAYILK